MKLKNIIKSMFLLLVVTIFATGCQEDILKEDYENADASKLPTLTLTVNNVTYESAVASATITTNGDDVFSEKGFIVSTDASFLSAESVIVTEGDAFMNALSLAGSTTYFVKAYTVSLNGVATSEATEFTTPEAPKFEDTYLYGTYTETDYDLDGVVEAVYEGAIVLSEKAGSANQMYIENFWAGGETIVATVDFENKTISVAPQIIYIDGTYGDCYIVSLYQADGSWTYDETSIIIGTYDENGTITLGSWGARVSAGFFGTYLGSTLQKVN
ncbi:hypothetical protein [Roseimarinus sediminis]|uniref:hypothetical protein n=1 Tax=Roseimarinus sediminis TaxID=1610899 RepID=UPI003D24DC46